MTQHATCPLCGKPNLPLRQDGTMKAHGPKQERCAGSGSTPTAARLIKDAIAEMKGAR